MTKKVSASWFRSLVTTCWLAMVLLPVAAANNFPRWVHFRGKYETFNTYYDFVVRDCKIWFRPRNDTTSAWKPLKVHKKLTCPCEISADSDRMVALDSANTIYYLRGTLDMESGKYRWTRRWGAPFSQGLGMTVPKSNNGWSLSQVSPVEDRFYLALNGNKHDVGKGVVNIYILSQEGQRITYIDPWLPNDLSYEVGSPYRCRFRSVSISASGSAIFIINKYGDMYTILYDFDVSGADDFFFNYTYEPEKHVAADTSRMVPRKFPRPLPLPGWTKQPKINGTITDRITIYKVPPGTHRRTLMVEGKDSLGHTGYYTKDISAPAWEFVKTGEPLKGNLLENSLQDRSLETLGPDESAPFRYSDQQVTMDIPDFHLYWPWSTLVITIKDCQPCTLQLYTHEVIRQLKRDRGYENKGVLLRGAIKVPAALRKNRTTLEAPVRDFLDEYFAERQYTEVKIWAKSTYLKLIDSFNFRWTFLPAGS